MSLKAMNWAWYQHAEPPSAKLLLLALADHAREDGTCWPGIKGLAEKCSISDRNVTRMIRTLEKSGFIETEAKRIKGHQANTKFRLLMGQDHPKPARQSVRLKTPKKETVQPDNLTPSQPDNLTPSQPDILVNSSLTLLPIQGGDTLFNEPKNKANIKPPPPPQKNNARKAGGKRFEEFWIHYPNKTGKKPCRTKWITRDLDSIADKIIQNVILRAESDSQWLDGFVPNPATYINQDRWEDEMSAPKNNGPISAQEARRRSQAEPAALYQDGKTFDQNGKKLDQNDNEIHNPLTAQYTTTDLF